MKIEIGKVVNTHGIRGELKVYSNSDFIKERFKVGNVVELKDHQTFYAFTIHSMRIHKGMVLISFEGLNNINFVEKYKGCSVYCEVDDESLLEENENYYFDLSKCNVYENDECLGKVVDILDTQAHPILRVKKADGSNLLIPYVEAFILDVNLDELRIDVRLIEGMQ